MSRKQSPIWERSNGVVDDQRAGALIDLDDRTTRSSVDENVVAYLNQEAATGIRFRGHQHSAFGSTLQHVDCGCWGSSL